MDSAESVRPCGGRVLTKFWSGTVSFRDEESKSNSLRRPYERWLRLEFADRGMKNKRIEGRQAAMMAARVSIRTQVLKCPGGEALKRKPTA